MTISYNLNISSSSSVSFFKLLFRWRGSVWKCIYRELIFWLLCFFAVSTIYRFLLTDLQRKVFEDASHYFSGKLDLIPLTFMLGFFVTIVVSRWGQVFENIGFIDGPAMYVANVVRGVDEETRITRRNIVRYLVLTQALVFRDISMPVRKRFPVIDTLVAAGLLLEHEKKALDEVQIPYEKYWLPVQWASALLVQAREEGKISSDPTLCAVMEKVEILRSNLATLCSYDWVPVPLVYPQVVFLSVRCYFAICLISRQFVVDDRDLGSSTTIDLVFPIMTVLQFIFYTGWMKVAESLMSPFGEDDDGFECNYLLDRNLTIGLKIADLGSNKPPEQMRDMFWSEAKIEPLYSLFSAQRPINPLVGSVADIKVVNEAAQVVMVPREEKELYDDDKTVGGIVRKLSTRLSRGIYSTRHIKARPSNTPRRPFNRPFSRLTAGWSRNDRRTSNIEQVQDYSHYKPRSMMSELMSTSTNFHSIIDEMVKDSYDPYNVETSHLPPQTPTNTEANKLQSSPPSHQVHLHRQRSLEQLESVPEERVMQAFQTTSSTQPYDRPTF